MPVIVGFPGGSDGKESACNVGDLGSIIELGRSPGGRHDNQLQYSCQVLLSMGILQARILEWVAMRPSRESSWPRDQTCVSYIAGRFFTSWTIEEVARVKTTAFHYSSKAEHWFYTMILFKTNFDDKKFLKHRKQGNLYNITNNIHQSYMNACQGQSSREQRKGSFIG